MKNSFLKKAIPHIIALVVMFTVMIAYFGPLFQGKVLKQYDVLQWRSTYQEISQFEKQSEERTFWTNSIFSGMPSYLIGASYSGNLTNSFLLFMQKIFKNPADTIFFLFVCFYILLLTFDVSPWLAIIGALAFTFSSFNFINIDAGHVTKGNAIAFIPLVLAGINITLHKNKILGALLTGVAVSFQLAAGHLQITYYLIFILLAWMLVEIFNAIKTKKIMHLAVCGAYLAIAGLVGVGTNITGLLATEEYGKYSIRGKSELTKTADDKSNAANVSSGLDKDYALAWSNGMAEPMTILIPDFFGGSSSESFIYDKKSETLKVLQENSQQNTQLVNQLAQQNSARYWGEQPFTAGPIYYGAIIIFLFVLGVFVIKGNEKWWIFGAALLSVFLSMGKNFMPLTDLFFNYFPLYNKFRSVTFILCVAQTMFPLMAVLALKSMLNGSMKTDEMKIKLLYSFYIVGGICLLFALVPGVFLDFLTSKDSDPNNKIPEWYLNAIAEDRAAVLKADAWRSFIFVALAFVAIYLFVIKKIKSEIVLVGMGIFILFDLWQVDKRYLNDKDFEKQKKEAAVAKTQYDEQILQDPDPHYRVFNTTTDFDKDAITAYYHKSIGGYHGAKMRRYQELIEWQLAKNNMECINMLNVKYFIVRDDSSGQLFAQRNPFNNGNAWFVKSVKWVANADEEIVALNWDRNNPEAGFNAKETAVIDKRFENDLKNFNPVFDSTANIKLTKYAPNKINYECSVNSAQLALFSEIFYDKGWNAYLDGKAVSHFRADYVLRAMVIPAGKHQIEFKFEPQTVVAGEKIAWASSSILYGGLIVLLAFYFSRKNKVVKNN